MEIKQALRIKYGLGNDPTDDQIRRWVQSTRNAIFRGERPESAGITAARSVFPDFETYVYKTEAETIEALLNELMKRNA